MTEPPLRPSRCALCDLRPRRGRRLRTGPIRFTADGCRSSIAAGVLAGSSPTPAVCRCVEMRRCSTRSTGRDGNARAAGAWIVDGVDVTETTPALAAPRSTFRVLGRHDDLRLHRGTRTSSQTTAAVRQGAKKKKKKKGSSDAESEREDDGETRTRRALREDVADGSSTTQPARLDMGRRRPKRDDREPARRRLVQCADLAIARRGRLGRRH